MKYVLLIISILLVLASFGCSDSTSKQGKARETKYLYRIYFVDYRGEKEYDNPYHENKECISIKAAQRKRPDLAIERFGVDDINELCFCPCVSDKTYKMILEKVKLKESNIFYDNRKKLYDALSDDYDMGSFKKFCADIKDAMKRRKLYDAISSSYSDIGSFEEFESKLGYGTNGADGSNEAASGDSVAAAEPQHTDNTFTAGAQRTDNIHKMYERLSTRFDLGTEEQFRDYVTASTDNSKKMYKRMSTRFELGSEQEWLDFMGGAKQQRETAAAKGDAEIKAETAAAEPQPTDNTFTAGVNHKENLYKVLTKRFNNLGSFEEFSSKLDNYEHRRNLHNILSKRFDNLGSFEEFSSKLGYDKAKYGD